MTQARSDHFFAIDVVRALASMYVMIFHINEPIPFISNWWTVFCKQGWLGVPAFFVVSGFCMALIAGRHSPARFLLMRLTRIYLPYWCSLVFVILCLVLLKLATGTNDAMVVPRDAMGIISHGLLALSPLTDRHGINWVYWSLVVEVLFYGWLAVCLLARNWRSAMFALLLAPLALTAWREVNWQFLGHNLHPLIWLKHYPVFLAGYLLHQLLQRRWEGGALLPVLIVSGVTHTFGEGVAVLLTLSVIAFLKVPSGKMQRIVSRGSDISYSLYLIHVPLACFLLLRVRNWFIPWGAEAHAAADLVLLAVTLVVASGFYRFIERPSHELARRLGRQA